MFTVPRRTRNLLCTFAFCFLPLAGGCAATDAAPAAQGRSAAATVNLFIDWSSEWHDPPWQAYDFIPIPSGASVLTAMQAAQGMNPPLTFEYTGSGSNCLLASIGGVANNQDNNGYWWIYYVNGTMGNVAFCSYVLSPGDSIAWDYQHYSRGNRQPGQAAN